MKNLLNQAGRMVLLSILVGCTSIALSGSHNRSKAVSANPMQTGVSQDISDTYTGLVLFRNKSQGQCPMVGLATLKIKGTDFTLSNKEGKQLKGTITTSILPEQGNLGVGNLSPENGDEIEIRWHRDAKRKILKIWNAEGAKWTFRFCSANLTQFQCFDRL